MHNRSPRQLAPACACRVVKVGGSLLDLPGLGHILRAWVAAQPPLANLLVVGGGTLADQVRRLDQLYHLPGDAAHWLAIRAMDLNGYVLSHLVPGARWIPDCTAWTRDPTAAGQELWVLAVEPFLRHGEPAFPGRRLPCGWQVTSDSIAARVAAVCQATELVLLKSVNPAPHGAALSLSRAASLQWVDEFFPASAESLQRIRAVNLRDPAFAEVRLTA